MSADSAHGESRLVLFAALAANLGIAVAKFVAAGIAGSATMLTEGFHSAVDRLNQILLLRDQKRVAPGRRDAPGRLWPRAAFVALRCCDPAGAVERMIAEIESDLRARWTEIGSLYIKPKAMVNASP